MCARSAGDACSIDVADVPHLARLRVAARERRRLKDLWLLLALLRQQPRLPAASRPPPRLLHLLELAHRDRPRLRARRRGARSRLGGRGEFPAGGGGRKCGAGGAEGAGRVRNEWAGAWACRRTPWWRTPSSPEEMFSTVLRPSRRARPPSASPDLHEPGRGRGPTRGHFSGAQMRRKILRRRLAWRVKTALAGYLFASRRNRDSRAGARSVRAAHRQRRAPHITPEWASATPRSSTTRTPPPSSSPSASTVDAPLLRRAASSARRACRAVRHEAQLPDVQRRARPAPRRRAAADRLAARVARPRPPAHALHRDGLRLGRRVLRADRAHDVGLGAPGDRRLAEAAHVGLLRRRRHPDGRRRRRRRHHQRRGDGGGAEGGGQRQVLAADLPGGARPRNSSARHSSRLAPRAPGARFASERRRLPPPLRRPPRSTAAIGSRRSCPRTA